MKTTFKQFKKAALRLIPEFVKYKIFEDKCLEYPNRCLSVKWSIKNLQRLGFEAEYIIDIGAYAGSWTEMIKEIYTDAKVLMIEPQLGQEKNLIEVFKKYPGTVTYSMLFLGAQTGESVDFFEMETGSSAYQERSSIPRRKVTKSTIRLDDFLHNLNWGKADFIKIDAGTSYFNP